ncbi:PHP domain-containing protein [Pelotomaculum isophthalicicum JI]|uniref:PHP domain-containing protein n=1 Tax=Pelotomaculum isophthalicicum JI TaxID=947010 RepID=A0A9X4H2S5_9FIRM|nr:PHP domain-containing protein [Pelotomaculum isophthalicicum]MDF9409075.1 PHP domain-containing protein [Pelotomaculum isophthalicicum JI]
MREWVLDLHVHTILSPCASDDMVPPLVLSRVRQLGVEVIAITDHNSAENVPAFMAKGKEMGIEILPGMEVQTREDIHMVCLFDTLEQVLDWQRIIYNHLPDLKNKKKSFGEQWVVDHEGNKLREVERLLLMGTDLTVEEVVRGVHHLGGLCIAAHIDRKAFSLWGSLGFIPDDLPIDGVELTPHLSRDQAQLDQLKERSFYYLVSSDAHWLDGISPPQCFAAMESCTIKELKLALLKKDGRHIRTIR